MHNGLALVWAGLAGSVLGAIFFGGLWWTVRKSMTFKQPALLLLASLLLRIGIILPAFYFVAHSHWERILACLFGFVMARFVATRLAGAQFEHIASSTKENRHAPQSR